MHAEYGCGKSEDSQMVWLFIYVLNAAASAVLLSLLLSNVFVTSITSLCVWSACVASSAAHRGVTLVCDGRWSMNDITGASVGLIISHGILVLASVIHHVPTAAPHKQVDRGNALCRICRRSMALRNCVLCLVVLISGVLADASLNGSVHSERLVAGCCFVPGLPRAVSKQYRTGQHVLDVVAGTFLCPFWCITHAQLEPIVH